MTATDPPSGPLPARPRAPAGPRKPVKAVIYRHTVVVRLTHWINALAIFVMVGSGLNIFNAHPGLYWGRYGSELDHAWLTIHAVGQGARARGLLTIGPLNLNTTGVLGLSGRGVGRAWPSWITIPSAVDLADARHWHFLFAWLLSINGLAYLIWSVGVGHVQRDLWPTWSDLKAIPRSVVEHVRLKHPAGEDARRYNVLQRLAYLGLIALVLLMVLSGLTMSPGFDAAAPGLLDLFGGRQSARSIHFLCMIGIVGFIVVHLTEVVLAGPINEVRSMITGRYAAPLGHDDLHDPALEPGRTVDAGDAARGPATATAAPGADRIAAKGA